MFAPVRYAISCTIKYDANMRKNPMIAAVIPCFALPISSLDPAFCMILSPATIIYTSNISPAIKSMLGRSTEMRLPMFENLLKNTNCEISTPLVGVGSSACTKDTGKK